MVGFNAGDRENGLELFHHMDGPFTADIMTLLSSTFRIDGELLLFISYVAADLLITYS